MATTATLRTATLLALVTAWSAEVAADWTFVDPGLLHGPQAMQGSARGTALVLGALAVPVLLLSVWKTQRGSGFALVAWAGALLYVVYNAVLFLFLTPFNTAFLVYVALLGSALWSVGYLAATRELWRVGRVIASRAPVRGVATYVWVIAALNAAAWLAMVIPSLVPYPTPMLHGRGCRRMPSTSRTSRCGSPWPPSPHCGCVVGRLAGLWCRCRPGSVGHRKREHCRGPVVRCARGPELLGGVVDHGDTVPGPGGGAGAARAPASSLDSRRRLSSRSERRTRP